LVGGRSAFRSSGIFVDIIDSQNLRSSTYQTLISSPACKLPVAAAVSKFDIGTHHEFHLAK
jgi:hypothetical protein